MNETAAANLVKTTFENPYSRERFLAFAKNLFHSIEPSTFVYRGKYIPDAYKTHIKTLERIGKYEDGDNNKIDILAACLKKQSSLERARTMQRNFIAWYLNGSRGNVAKDAALVAFYTKGSSNWRLSLVKMDYSLAKSKKGKLKAIIELTPARRFSFSVGSDENTHTAQRRLKDVLKKDDHPPALTDLEDAFSVEVVTKDFFEKYKTLFLNTEEALNKIVARDAKIKADFDEKNFDTVDFTKKLLGQIVFLYFLQKKGWFGVKREQKWGSGPKDFLRELFEKKHGSYRNFFNDILEPLFYNTLAVERQYGYSDKFDCRIPFLNGGLFEPLNDYDWYHTDILLPNELFSNDVSTKEGDRGTGILDVFDRYNFTVKEDEPLEKEVAVDPEMLGKVFENLLEVKDRKSKGTYYTPREIVHYMCQESLVNYLVTELEGKVKRDDIETLIRLGETAVEHDSRVVAHGEETETYQFKLPQSIRKNASLIDESLESIKVCDPAVGSGAFLVGMMTEIIRARNTLSSYLPKNDRSIYAFKRHAIQNCLYGVDIDPGAVEIAKLRLWLSLIVDEQDIKQIKPLPNLDYKIMQGNSLLEEYEGIKLFDEGIVSASPFDNIKQIEEVKEKLNELQREFFKFHSAGELKGSKKQRIEAELKRQNDLFNKLRKTKKAKPDNGSLFDQLSQAKKKADELKKLHQEFFEAAHKKEKDRLKKEIETLEWDLIETTLREQNKLSLLPEIERFKKTNIKPFFLWKLNFSEVFEKNGGFDVVIANPPYISFQQIDRSYKDIYKRLYNSARGKYDIYLLFIETGLKLLVDYGYLCYIVPNKFIRSGYGAGIKEVLLRHDIKQIVDFNDLQVFDDVTNYTCVILVGKNKDDTTPSTLTFSNVKEIEVNEFIGETLTIRQDNLGSSVWVFGNSTELLLMDKIKKQKKTLGDISKTITQGIRTGALQVFFNNVDLKFVESKKIEKGLLIPIHHGKNIKKYQSLINEENDLLLFPYKNDYKTPVNIERFPNAKSYLEKYKEKLLLRKDSGRVFKESDKKWFEYWDPKPMCFSSPKILFPDISNTNQFHLDTKGIGYLNSCYGIFLKKGINHKAVLALLNSRLIEFFIKKISPFVRGGFYRYKTGYIKQIPIHAVITENGSFLNTIVKMVDKILAVTGDKRYLENSAKRAYVRKYEHQIDQMVYELYSLTQEEVKVVEEGAK